MTPTTQADLAVAMTGPASAVFTNDWMTYGVNVTNLGPASASNVMLTNTLPPGVGYKTNSLAFTRQGSGSNVVFNLGTLASGAFTNFHPDRPAHQRGQPAFFVVCQLDQCDRSQPHQQHRHHQHHRHQLLSRQFGGLHQLRADLSICKMG